MKNSQRMYVDDLTRLMVIINFSDSFSFHILIYSRYGVLLNLPLKLEKI